MSSISAFTSALGGNTSSTNAAAWLEPSSSSSSSASWLDGTSSQTGSTAQAVWGSSNSLSNSLASAATSNIDGENNLAGEAALTRVEAALEKKEAQQAGLPGSSTPSGGSGYTVVQNLMASLDDITINNGGAPPTSVGSSSAANGYSAVQNLMTSLDNITINNGSSGVLPGANAPNALMGVDSIIATPKVNIKA